MKPIQIFPTDRNGWWRFAFYILETLVVCMTVELEHLYLQFPSLPGPLLPFVIWLSAMVMLLVVCIVIRRSCRIHAIIGFLTVVVVFVIGLLSPQL